MTGPAGGTSPERFSAQSALALGFGAIAALVIGLAGWGVFASVAGAVIVMGQVETETRDQVVEHVEGGTISEILARNGDLVAKGDQVLRFDDTALRSEEAMLDAELVDLTARHARLQAEFRGDGGIDWYPELTQRAEHDAGVREVMTGQERIFQARVADRRAEADRLGKRIGQTREQIRGLEAQAGAVGQQHASLVGELAGKRMLYEKGLLRLDDLLALERETQRLEGQLGAIAASIASARGLISELEVSIMQIDTRQIEESVAEAREIQARRNQVRERLAAVRERLAELVLRAPVAGEVFDMAVFTPREVVLPGEPILRIVPQDAALVVLARLAPINVDQVYPGQEAVLRFSAYPARITPTFEGRLTRVSGQAVLDEQSGFSWYEVEIAILGPRGGEEDTPPAGNPAADLVLTPGMPVEVHIRTGDRSPLSYLAKPLTDFFSRAFRED